LTAHGGVDAVVVEHPRGAPPVLGHEGPHLLGTHHVDQAGLGEHVHMMPDRALGFSEHLGQLGGGGGPCAEQAPDLLPGVIEEGAVLMWFGQEELIGQVVVRNRRGTGCAAGTSPVVATGTGCANGTSPVAATGTGCAAATPFH